MCYYDANNCFSDDQHYVCVFAICYVFTSLCNVGKETRNESLSLVKHLHSIQATILKRLLGLQEV